MVITISAVSRCVGTNHVTVTGTAGGVAVSATFLRSELDLEPDAVREAVITRCRSACKEAGATTPAQIQTALVGKTFQV
jgi:hypothetical protein